MRTTPVRAETGGTSWLPGVERICYGGDYNPEQWPEEVWVQDVALMREAGVNLVSIGIFSWALVEPREGEFDFTWLDRLFDLLHINGIRVDLATPTAAPPAWFYAAYPHARVVTRDGVVLGPGSRGMVSPASPDYRRLATRIAGELATRYGDHPALALWHVHNEYGAPVAEDFSPASTVAFRRWLEQRYGTLAALNDAWGTAFWGQRYVEWDHIECPAASASVVNPAHRLDFARYTSDALLRCFIAERDAIHAHSTVPVTTNFMAGECPFVDLWRWAREVDVVANDHYLRASDPDNHIRLALAADLTRSVAGGKPWLLLEHSTSAVNWQPRNVAKRAGEMRRNAFQHLGRGADAIMFFQWRASRRGAEKFHSAMVPHSGADSRIFREVVALGADLRQVRAVRGSRVEADVALLWDWESFWAQDLEWRPSIDLDHRQQIEAFHEQLWRDGLTADFAHPEADLSRYRLVIAPASYLLTTAAADNLTRYVADGGTLVVSCFSGIVDENDAVHAGGYLAPLAQVLGVRVEEFLPLRQGEVIHLTDHTSSDTGADPAPRGLRPEHRALDVQAPGAAKRTAKVWAEHLCVGAAEVMARYVDGPAASGPALTRHRYGLGTGWYLSTKLDASGLAEVLTEAYVDAGLHVAPPPAGVEVMRRRSQQTTYLVVVNHNVHPVHLSLPGLDLLTAEIAGPQTPAPLRTLRGGDVVVLQC